MIKKFKKTFLLASILFFICILSFFKIKEGLENKKTNYKPYDDLENNPTFLMMKNSSNIASLKESLDELKNIKSSINSLNAKVELNEEKIKKTNEMLTKTHMHLSKTTNMLNSKIPSKLSNKK